MSKTRKERLVSYVTEEELRLIEESAEKDGRTLSDFIRRAALIISAKVKADDDSLRYLTA